MLLYRPGAAKDLALLYDDRLRHQRRVERAVEVVGAGAGEAEAERSGPHRRRGDPDRPGRERHVVVDGADEAPAERLSDPEQHALGAEAVVADRRARDVLRDRAARTSQ